MKFLENFACRDPLFPLSLTPSGAFKIRDPSSGGYDVASVPAGSPELHILFSIRKNKCGDLQVGAEMANPGVVADKITRFKGIGG